MPGDGQEGCQGRKPLHEVQRAPQCLSRAQRPQAHLDGVHVPLPLPSATCPWHTFCGRFICLFLCYVFKQIYMYNLAKTNQLFSDNPVVFHRTVEYHRVRSGGILPDPITRLFVHIAGIGNLIHI